VAASLQVAVAGEAIAAPVKDGAPPQPSPRRRLVGGRRVPRAGKPLQTDSVERRADA
jgi:hypothetical protein